MNLLNNFWPWKELNRLNEEVEFLKRTLEHEQTSHNITRASLQDHKLELIDHKSRNVQSQKDIRKLATILAMRGGITLILIFLSLSALGQPLQRNPVTTNLLGNAASVSYFLGWDGSKPAWGVPPDGLGTNSWLTNASFIFPIPHLAASNDLGWWNSGGDVSANATNNDKLFGLNATNEVARMGTSITNGAILNLSNLVSTISQNATNEALLIGQNATNNDTVVSNGITARIIKSLGITVDGGGATLVSGVKGYLEVPVACTIISATILADQSGSIAIETWRTNSSSMPPTRAGVLFTNVLTSAQASTDSTLANATSLSLATQDRIGFNIITNALSVTRVTLQLRVQP